MSEDGSFSRELGCQFLRLVIEERVVTSHPHPSAVEPVITTLVCIHRVGGVIGVKAGDAELICPVIVAIPLAICSLV